jgi:hypothetical protein
MREGQPERPPLATREPGRCERCATFARSSVPRVLLFEPGGHWATPGKGLRYEDPAPGPSGGVSRSSNGGRATCEPNASGPLVAAQDSTLSLFHTGEGRLPQPTLTLTESRMGRILRHTLVLTLLAEGLPCPTPGSRCVEGWPRPRITRVSDLGRPSGRSTLPFVCLIALLVCARWIDSTQAELS